MSEQINLNDFATAVNVIDICTQRGAFKGEEMLTVGQLRQKFVSFIEENSPSDKAAPSETLENFAEETEESGE